MNREIIPKVKIIISHSMKEAKSFDDVKIRPEHLVLSILLDEDNEGAKTLSGLKIDNNEFYDIVSDHLRKTIITPSVNGVTKRTLPFSDESKIIIKSLDDECEKLSDTLIDTTHILLAILNTKSPLTTLLNKAGVTYTRYKNMMKKMREDFPKNSAYSDDEKPAGELPKGSSINKSEGSIKAKTPVLDNFCRDISKAVENGEVDKVIGREKEIKRISQILSRRKKNNPIIIGEPGVGKSAIVEGLAQLILDGDASPTLTGKRIFTLDLASIVAGTKYRGQFEERMKAILEECKANPDIVLFIDELHTIIGAGNASGSLDASNIFKPALARGELQVIGATTLDEYRENIEKDGALTRRFQQVLVAETTIEETKHILMNIKDKYEKHHKVKYSDEAINECVRLSDRYIMDKAMPDKAIDVLDEAGASMNMTIEKPENIKLLEARKTEIMETKKMVVLKQKYEEAAKLRDEEKKVDIELLAANTDWKIKLATNVSLVGPEIISEVVSMMTGIPLTKISTQESKKLLDMDKDLIGKVIGQDSAVTKVIKAIKRNRIGIKDKNKPVGSFIFLGPTGVGKTLLAKLLAEEVFGDSDALVRMDMSEYMEKHSVSRLVGPPPGYVGYEQGGQLTEKVRRKPHCVILFDEIEKAHEDVFNLLLQLLDEGMLTDGLGRKVNFKNALIILTSNIGVKEVASFGKNMGFESESAALKEDNKARLIIEKALKKKFRPEFLNRIDEAIIFNSLTEQDIHKIIYVEIAKLENRLKDMKFKLKINKSAMDFLATEGYDELYGARPLTRAIQHYVEDPIADEILNGSLKEGDTINVTFDKDKEEIVVKGSKPKMTK
jgi:ATP-dependent Clp protease ATP-binding subunit ClpC